MQHLESLDARRLFAFGSKDHTFGDNGHVKSLPLSEYVYPTKTLVESDGRIVVAGWHGHDWALRRYLPDGKTDTSFGDGGIFKFSELSEIGKVELLAETSDGGLYVGGRANLPGETFTGERNATMLIAKLTFDGSVDRDFLPDDASNVSQAGYFRVGASFGLTGFNEDVVKVVRGGNLIVATDLAGGGNDTLFTRYNTDGQLDRTFGNGGRVDVNVPVPTDTIDPPGKLPMSYRSTSGILSLAEAPDGSVVGAGFYTYARGSNASDDTGPYTAAYLPYFVRIGAHGELLGTKVYQVDINKAQASHYTGLSLAPYGMRVGPDSKVYVFSQQLLVRFNADFTLDTAWSDDGIAATSAAQDGTVFTATLADVEVQADGKVVGVARDVFSSLGVNKPIIVRYNHDGSTDASMQLESADGNSDLPSDNRSLNSVAFAPDGTIIVAGENYPLTRVFRDEGPAGRFEGASVSSATAGFGYKFGVTWRDDDGIDLGSLDNGDLQILTPGGGKLTARVLSKTTNPDGSVLMRYRAGPVNGVSWTSADNGSYTIKLLSNRVADITGALAAGRTLGTFQVRVPDAPILESITAATGRGKHKLAPNT